MSSHDQADKTRLCPDGHENPLDSSICRTCHLPILDYDAELAHFLKALAAEDPVRDELKGLTSGTALAAILRPAGLVLKPHSSGRNIA